MTVRLRRAVLATALLVVLPLLPVSAAPEAEVRQGPVVQRVAGPGRVETAVAVSASAWESADTVVVATAGQFADALAAGALAARRGAPLLLTGSEAIPQVVLDEVARLGAEDAVVLGGSGAVSDAAVQQLEGAGVVVERIAGPDRFTTAAAAAQAAGIGDEVLIALGGHADPARAWPDALSAGAFAATPGAPPLLLVGGDSVPEPTRAVLADGDVQQLTIVGGTAAVGDVVAAELSGLAASVGRISGDSRYATSAAVAERVLGELEGEVPLIAASGANFPDGLAAAALAAERGGLLVLVPPRRLVDAPAVVDLLEANRERFSDAVVIGGAGAVGEGTVADLADVLAGRPLQPDAPPPVPQTPPPGYSPDPLHVDVSVDESAASSGEATPDDAAQITATGPDGSLYTLSVPAGAVTEPTDITLTPITSVDGHPFSAVQLGVDFGPDGLELLQPAELRITPAAPVDQRGSIGAAYRGQGSELHLAPMRLEADGTIVAQVERFSGRIVASATPEQVQAAGSRTPADAAAALSNEVTQLIIEGRQADMLGVDESTPSDPALLQGFILRWYDEVVIPLLEQAIAAPSLRTARDAVTSALSAERQLQLLGITDSSGMSGDPAFDAELRARQDRVAELLPQVADAAIRLAHQRCTAAVDDQSFFWLLSTARQLAILGDQPFLGTSSSDALLDLAQECLHITGDIAFESDTVSVHQNDPYVVTSRSEMDAELRSTRSLSDDPAAQVLGRLVWSYDNHEDWDGDCPSDTYRSAAGEDDLVAEWLSLDALYARAPGATEVQWGLERPDVTATGTSTTQCPPSPPFTQDAVPFEFTMTAHCPVGEEPTMRRDEVRVGERLSKPDREYTDAMPGDVVSELWGLTCESTVTRQFEDIETTQTTSVAGELHVPPAPAAAPQG